MQYRQRRTELRAGSLLIELIEMTEDVQATCVSALNRNTPQAHVELAETTFTLTPVRTAPLRSLCERLFSDTVKNK